MLIAAELQAYGILRSRGGSREEKRAGSGSEKARGAQRVYHTTALLHGYEGRLRVERNYFSSLGQTKSCLRHGGGMQAACALWHDACVKGWELACACAHPESDRYRGNQFPESHGSSFSLQQNVRYSKKSGGGGRGDQKNVVRPNSTTAFSTVQKTHDWSLRRLRPHK